MYLYFLEFEASREKRFESSVRRAAPCSRLFSWITRCSPSCPAGTEPREQTGRQQALSQDALMCLTQRR